MKSITAPLLLINLSYISLLITLAAVSSILAFGLGYERFVVYGSGTALYFALWLIGHHRYLKDNIRLSARKRRTYNRFDRTINPLILALLFFVFATTNIYPPLTQLVLFGLPTEVATRVLFLILSPSSAIAFYMYHRQLSIEKGKNASKLAKVRIQLLQYAIYFQAIMAFSMVVFVSLLLLQTFPVELLNASLYITNSVFCLISSFIARYSVHIPNRLRARYNIAPSRYAAIKIK